jgi:hypothetical protein
MHADGTYTQRRPRSGHRDRSSQEALIEAAHLRGERAKRLRKVKPRAFARRGPRAPV